MLLAIAILFLGVGILFYTLFGGADFGAGVFELLSGKKERDTIADAIGPVWEANHVWLVLVVVILFMGFPNAYAKLSLYLHIPLAALLIGIVFRGTAFVYMHYDAIQDRTNKVYNWTFKISSIWAPVFLGMTVGAVMLGRMNPNADTFYAAFMDPWLNWFCLAMGLFVLMIFTWLAAVYLIGETTDEEQRSRYSFIARYLNAATVISGALVFVAAEASGLPLLQMFMDSYFATTAAVFATAILPLLWYALIHHAVIWSRALTVVQVTIILLAWFYIQFPVMLNMQSGEDITFFNAAAPDATLLQMDIALIVGSCIILPFLFYLMKTFKGWQFN